MTVKALVAAITHGRQEHHTDLRIIPLNDTYVYITVMIIKAERKVHSGLVNMFYNARECLFLCLLFLFFCEFFYTARSYSIILLSVAIIFSTRSTAKVINCLEGDNTKVN